MNSHLVLSPVCLYYNTIWSVSVSIFNSYQSDIYILLELDFLFIAPLELGTCSLVDSIVGHYRLTLFMIAPDIIFTLLETTSLSF